ncbi:vesicular glutamate transporter 2.2 [Nephila pilipes]|uniref:Vesicular glutamate transporter 2.2 n=1 Tax=Nephila pilipes TaxID=299642 RepID=A0A8X6P5U6_NEPPI|nr:vesicular glutamate transporter 2.2 [Nephila pilipes]
METKWQFKAPAPRNDRKGTLMGLASTIACVAAFLFPLLIGIMTNEEQTSEQWNKIFMLCIALIMSLGIIFCVFGSADIQSSNYPENDKNHSEEKKAEKPTEVIAQSVDAVDP